MNKEAFAMLDIKVLDLFCGCGGTSAGFKRAGFQIALGLDVDVASAATFKRNFPEAEFIQDDIRNVTAERISKSFLRSVEDKILLSGCAPCQPFSKINKNRNKNDSRLNLLAEFERVARSIRPHFIFLENVPGVQNIDQGSGVFDNFCQFLSSDGYHFCFKVVRCSDFGVPQQRRRLVLLASRDGKIAFPSMAQIPPCNLDVRHWISDLPALIAGEVCENVPNHAAANLSDQNLARIRAIPPGKDRRVLPSDLALACHTDHVGHSDVYGRLRWDRPSAAITTRCVSLSNGRFGHPDQDRAISAREAARLQTFPDTFIFEGSLTSVARQIGNAVPPLMATTLASAFISQPEIV